MFNFFKKRFTKSCSPTSIQESSKNDAKRPDKDLIRLNKCMEEDNNATLGFADIAFILVVVLAITLVLRPKDRLHYQFLAIPENALILQVNGSQVLQWQAEQWQPLQANSPLFTLVCEECHQWLSPNAISELQGQIIVGLPKSIEQQIAQEWFTSCANAGCQKLTVKFAQKRIFFEKEEA